MSYLSESIEKSRLSAAESDFEYLYCQPEEIEEEPEDDTTYFKVEVYEPAKVEVVEVETNY